MGSTGVASSMAGQCQIQLQNFRPQHALACCENVQRGRFAPLRLSCYGNSAIRIRRRSFGALESRRFRSETGRLRNFVVRAREGDKEKLGIDKVEGKSLESWTISFRRANITSRIFMAAFVWISLFFGISVANNEVSGGRPGRRGPRK